MGCEAQIPHLGMLSWARRENSQGSGLTLDAVWVLGLTVPGGEISGVWEYLNTAQFAATRFNSLRNMYLIF